MQDIKEEIIAAGLPEHIAIIMDGNGRWAEQVIMPQKEVKPGSEVK